MDRINEITKDCFNAVIQLRQMGAASALTPESLHQQLRTTVDTMWQRAGEAGLGQDDIKDVAYAVVALMDEVVLALPGEIRQRWAAGPLQLHYFNENNAGDGFFTRLESMHGDSRRINVLRVYYLCMALGFCGRYGIRGGESQLMVIFQSVEQSLSRSGSFEDDGLSPHGERPPEARRDSHRMLPLVWLLVGALAFSITLYTALRIWLGSETTTQMDILKELTQGTNEPEGRR